MESPKTFNFLTLLPIIVFFVGSALILTFPAFFTHTFLPPEIAAMTRAAVTILLFSIIVSRVMSGDYPGWTWGYVLNALSVLVTLVTAWIDLRFGNLATVLSLSATVAWVQSSLSQARRLRKAEYE